MLAVTSVAPVFDNRSMSWVYRLSKAAGGVRNCVSAKITENNASLLPSQTRIVGFVPNDVDALEITRAVKRRAPHVTFETRQLDADSEAVRLLTEEIAARAKLEGG